MRTHLSVAASFLACAVLLPSCKPDVAAPAESPITSNSAEPDVATSARDSSTLGREERPQPPFPRVNDVVAFANYRGWHKANTEPVRMNDIVAWMCASLDPETAAKMREELKSPHDVVQQWKTFTVFVNSEGKKRLTGATKGEFPVGTIIVKEKHDGDDASTSELLTVMIKREKGFAPEIGDWQFVVLSGFAKTVLVSDTETCFSCHSSKKSNDYVFADYLPKS